MAERKKQKRAAPSTGQRIEELEERMGRRVGAIEHAVGRLADDFNSTKRRIDQALDVSRRPDYLRDEAELLIRSLKAEQ